MGIVNIRSWGLSKHHVSDIEDGSKTPDVTVKKGRFEKKSFEAVKITLLGLEQLGGEILPLVSRDYEIALNDGGSYHPEI